MVHGQQPTTVRSKLTRLMLVAGVGPLLVLGGLAYLTMSGAVEGFSRGLDSSAQAMERGVVGASLAKAAEDLAGRIDSYIEERVRDVQIWALEPLVVEAAIRANAMARGAGWPGYPEIARDARSLERIEEEMKPTRSLNPLPAASQYLRDQLQLSRVFKDLSFTDRNGYNAGISHSAADFVQSDEEWWVNAWTRSLDIGGSSQNPLATRRADPGSARVVYDESARVWSLVIAVRIEHPRTREPVGVMKAVLDIAAVQALATRVAEKLPGGDAKVLVAGTGELIADTAVQHARRFVMSKEGNLLARGFRPAEAIARGDGSRSGYVIGHSETHGTAEPVEQVIGYARTAGKGDFKDMPGFTGLGWAAVVGQDRQQAFVALEDLMRVQATLVSQRQWVSALFLGVVAVTAASMVGLGAVMSRGIATPIQELSAAARRVSHGDLSVQVRVRSRDEIGQLVATFNDTVVRLRSQVRTEAERDEERRARQELQRNITRFLDTVVEISGGDLTRRGEVTADVLGSVVDAVNVMVEELAAILASVRAAALQVHAGSGEMMVAAADMTAGIQAQSREARAMTAAIEELARSVRDVASSAEESSRAAGQALESAERGDAAVQGSLGGMQRIRREVQTISKRMKGLGDRSLEISAIVSTIEELAGQTNLLALNATIEAAGAGEAGARFAIVADEIRRLADRAAHATKDIGELIRAVQTETQETILVTEHGTREVEAGYQITVQAGASLAEIAEVVKRSAALAQAISPATGQQAGAADTVTAWARSISTVAVETEHGVLRTRATIEELAKVADELTTTLARFKLAP